MIDLDELSKMFRTEAHDRLDELNAALRAQQPLVCDKDRLDDARRAAHNLKGAALTVGAQPVAGLCRILETEVQAQIESGGTPTAEQVGTWLYVVSEIAGIIDDPGIIHIQLTGFSDPPNPADAEPHQERTSSCVTDPNTTAAAAATTAGALTGKDLVAMLAQVARIQRTLVEQAQTLRAHLDECARPEATAAQQNSSAVLSSLREQLDELGLIVGQFAPPPT